MGQMSRLAWYNIGMKNMKHGGMGGGVYGVGAIGALIWVVRNADSVTGFLCGIVQAVFWPAVLVYKLFGFLA